jgi:hypothetical protein
MTYTRVETRLTSVDGECPVHGVPIGGGRP